MASFVYDGFGRVTWEEDAAGVVTERAYDALGNVVEEKVNGDVVMSATFDGEGNPLTMTASGVTTTFSYTDGVLTSVSVPDGTVTLGYDAYGLPSTATLPDARVFTVVHDALGRPVSQTSPGTGTVVLAYDDLGRVTSRTDENGEVQSWTYDADGNVLSYTDKLGNVSTMTWDAAGRLATSTDRNGTLTSYAYDGSGNVSSVSAGGSTRTATYDPLGRLLTASEGGVTVSKTWSVDGPVSETATYPGLSPMARSWTYDGSGRVGSSTDAWSAVTYGYDVAGRLSAVTDAELGLFELGYDAASRPTSVSRPGGLETTRVTDGVGRTTSVVTELSGVLKHTLGWTYDADGLPAARTDGEGTHTYDHDAAGRLVSVDHPSPLADESYSYDGPGRRTSWAGHDATEVVYDDGDRLVQDAAWTYTWDAEGQRTSRTARAPADTAVPETWTYSWDAWGRLVEVEDPSGSTWSYVYDPFDRRVGVHAPEGDTWYLYDGDLVAATLDGSGSLTSRYVVGFGFGEVLARVEGGVASYAVRDSLGTVVAWLSGSGAAVESSYRDAYGVRRDAAMSTEPWGFTGHAEDSNGLVWGRARYYEPEVGQWLREDFVWTTPRFNYADGAPCSKVDPTGLAELTAYEAHVRGACRDGTNVAEYYGEKAVEWNTAAAAAGKSTYKYLSGLNQGQPVQVHHIFPQTGVYADVLKEVLDASGYGMDDAKNLIRLKDSCHNALNSHKKYREWLLEMKDRGMNAQQIIDRVVEVLIK